MNAQSHTFCLDNTTNQQIEGAMIIIDSCTGGPLLLGKSISQNQIITLLHVTCPNCALNRHHHIQKDSLNIKISEHTQSIVIIHPYFLKVSIFKQLQKCTKLEQLIIGQNTINKKECILLFEAFRNWGNNCALRVLKLAFTGLKPTMSCTLVRLLNKCKLLKMISLGGEFRLPGDHVMDTSVNNLGGCLVNLAGDTEGFPWLEELHMGRTSLTAPDILSFTQLILAGKLPRLKHIDLRGERQLETYLKIMFFKWTETCGQSPSNSIGNIFSVIHTDSYFYYTSLPDLPGKGGRVLNGDRMILHWTDSGADFPIFEKHNWTNNEIGHEQLYQSFKTDPQQRIYLGDFLARYSWHINKLRKVEDQIGDLIGAFLSHHKLPVTIDLRYNNFSVDFVEKWQVLCDKTHVTLKIEDECELAMYEAKRLHNCKVAIIVFVGLSCCGLFCCCRKLKSGNIGCFSMGIIWGLVLLIPGWFILYCFGIGCSTGNLFDDRLIAHSYCPFVF